MSIRKVLVIPDVHIPYQDAASLRAMEAYMRDHSREWSSVVYLGDIIDLDCISSHNEHALRKVEGGRINADYHKAAALLERHQSLAPLAEFHWIEGNHEDRVNRYIDANPQVEGMIEVPNALELQTRGVNWIPFWSKGTVLRIGKAMFIHGRYINKYQTNKHLEAYGENVFYGHTHDEQNMTREL
ncbi:MAG: metallophosphoesterase family protein, partial [Nitrososphaera sp.]|nr:metallophosphoesterase family protein [Nitrososphaera sp.]